MLQAFQEGADVIIGGVITNWNLGVFCRPVETNSVRSLMYSVFASSFELSVLGGYSLEMLLARDGSRSSFLAKFRYFDVMARTASCSAYGLTGFSRR